jgi:hypothetical protein
VIFWPASKRHDIFKGDIFPIFKGFQNYLWKIFSNFFFFYCIDIYDKISQTQLDHQSSPEWIAMEKVLAESIEITEPNQIELVLKVLNLVDNKKSPIERNLSRNFFNRGNS